MTGNNNLRNRHKGFSVTLVVSSVAKELIRNEVEEQADVLSGWRDRCQRSLSSDVCIDGQTYECLILLEKSCGTQLHRN